VKRKRVLLAHSNVGPHLREWHERRRKVATELGYDVTNFSLAEYMPFVPFPVLNRKWKRRDRRLMALYDALGPAIAESDVFVHYNGAMIHPGFLSQFSQTKVYHCADDPDASRTLSEPVAAYYDVCAISNPACIEMYKSWGCKEVFFWPLGALHFEDGCEFNSTGETKRDVAVVFVGSKLGIPRVRFIGKYLGLYRKKAFMERIERSVPELVAYGAGWGTGFINDENVPNLYMRSRIGLNVHNSIGPVNGRLYDLAAFGVMQLCDNKANLNMVFEEDKEIVGYDTAEECVDLIRYYLAHSDEASAIAAAGRQRYLRDYTMTAIVTNFFKRLETLIRAKGGATPSASHQIRNRRLQ
jgi:spore maturation protein CgeB